MGILLGEMIICGGTAYVAKDNALSRLDHKPPPGEAPLQALYCAHTVYHSKSFCYKPPPERGHCIFTRYTPGIYTSLFDKYGFRHTRNVEFSVAVSRDKKLSFSTFETPFDLSRFTNKVSLDIKDGARDWDVHSNACKIIYLCIKPFLRTYERNSKRNLYID